MLLLWLIPTACIVCSVFIILLVVLKARARKNKGFIVEIQRNHKKQAGDKAESVVNWEIQKFINNELKGQGKTHPTFIFFVDKYRQYTCEIDNIVVTKGGIFIIETKGWKGNVTGNLDDKKWTKIKKYHITEFTYGYNTQSLDNPIQENYRHLKNFFNVWKKVCSDIPKITPIVIFPFLENPPEGTYNIQSAFCFITKLTTRGNYSIGKLESIISKMIEKYGATEEDHKKTLNRKEQEHNSLSF